jgi:hypothetical protein
MHYRIFSSQSGTANMNSVLIGLWYIFKQTKPMVAYYVEQSKVYIHYARKK